MTGARQNSSATRRVNALAATFRFGSCGVLYRCLLGSGKHVVNGSSELSHPGARNDDGISPAMGFLGNAKESPSIVFTELHVEVLPFDLNFLRFDNIVHVGREFGRPAGFVEAKNSHKFHDPKG